MKLFKDNIQIIEEHDSNGIVWIVSIEGANPQRDKCFSMTNQEDAIRLSALLKEYGHGRYSYWVGKVASDSKNKPLFGTLVSEFDGTPEHYDDPELPKRKQSLDARNDLARYMAKYLKDGDFVFPEQKETNNETT